MTRRSKVWLAAAVVFVAVNLGGVVYAAVRGELLHCAVHVALLVPGVWLVARLYRRGQDEADAMDLAADDFPDRLKDLEQSVDAVALEIERIGEGQRFMTRVLSDRAAKPVPVEQAAPAAAEVPKSATQSPGNTVG